jgi:8-oxo-dGTP pyrophosphatase MutT (NUDIX family)
MRRAAGLIVLNDDETHILMVGRKSKKIGIPGGKEEPGEHTIDTSIRETYEETGLVCRIPIVGRCYRHSDVEGYDFFAWRAEVVAGKLRGSSEGPAFWLDLQIFKRIPNILQYPEWSREAIEYFGL